MIMWSLEVVTLFYFKYLATAATSKRVGASRYQPPISPRVMVSTRSKRFAHINFRVLIMGRANAGKTTILQRVCDTTESPVIYRIVGGSREQVCESA